MKKTTDKTQVNLDLMSKKESYSIAMSLLYSLKNTPQYSVISELPYILDYNSFVKFIRYYGGMTIRVPTLEEISDIFKVLLLYQNKVVKQLSWDESLSKSGYNPEESSSARSKLSYLSKIIESQEVGKRSYE